MRTDLRLTEVPRTNDPIPPSTVDEDSLWAFLPILVAAAGICLFMYFFLILNFEAADQAGAKNPPAATISITVQQEKGNVQFR
jgi:hypothetical protein